MPNQQCQSQSQTDSQIRTIQTKNDNLQAELTQTQSNSAKHTLSMNQLQTDLETRYNAFISAQQLSVEMQQLYSRQRKLMWVYIVVFLILLGGVSYLYHTSFDSSQSIFTPEGRSTQSNNIGSAIDKMTPK